MAMNFVGDIQGTAAVFGNKRLPLLLRFEIPYGVVILWVLEQVFSSHWCHDRGYETRESKLVVKQAATMGGGAVARLRLRRRCGGP